MTITKVINKVESKLKREFVYLPIVSNIVRQSYNQKTLEHRKLILNF